LSLGVTYQKSMDPIAVFATAAKRLLIPYSDRINTWFTKLTHFSPTMNVSYPFSHLLMKAANSFLKGRETNSAFLCIQTKHTDAARKDIVEIVPLQFPFTEDNKCTHNKNGGIYNTSCVIESSTLPLINKMQYTCHSIPSLL